MRGQILLKALTIVDLVDVGIKSTFNWNGAELIIDDTFVVLA